MIFICDKEGMSKTMSLRKLSLELYGDPHVLGRRREGRKTAQLLNGLQGGGFFHIRKLLTGITRTLYAAGVAVVSYSGMLRLISLVRSFSEIKPEHFDTGRIDSTMGMYHRFMRQSRGIVPMMREFLDTSDGELYRGQARTVAATRSVPDILFGKVDEFDVRRAAAFEDAGNQRWFDFNRLFSDFFRQKVGMSEEEMSEMKDVLMSHHDGVTLSTRQEELRKKMANLGITDLRWVGGKDASVAAWNDMRIEQKNSMLQAMCAGLMNGFWLFAIGHGAADLFRWFIRMHIRALHLDLNTAIERIVVMLGRLAVGMFAIDAAGGYLAAGPITTTAVMVVFYASELAKSYTVGNVSTVEAMGRLVEGIVRTTRKAAGF